jgi:hypothetical protein
MGYYYNADFTIVVPESVAVAVSLDQANLVSWINSGPFSRGSANMNMFGSQNANGNTLVERMLDYCGFEWNTPAEVDEKGTVTYQGWANCKWHDTTEKIVMFLGQHGAGVDMTCTGEDGERWMYEARIGEGKTVSDSIVGVPAARLKELEDAYKTVADLREALKDLLPATGWDVPGHPVYARLAGLLAQEV